MLLFLSIRLTMRRHHAECRVPDFSPMLALTAAHHVWCLCVCLSVCECACEACMSHITAAANIMGKLYYYPIIVFKMRNMRTDAVIIATISVHCHRKYRFDEFALSILWSYACIQRMATRLFVIFRRTNN